MTTETSRLFVSFWHICLDNLPIGDFCHRLLSTEEVRTLLSQARQEGQFHCVSNDDLLAPYRERVLNKQRELCEVLRSHYGISITLEDFVWNGSEEELCYSIKPLQFAQVQENQKLLVITCSYEWLGLKEGLEKATKVSLDSLEFHLFERG